MLTRYTRHWLPFTQMDAFDPPARTFVRGDGNYLIDARGSRLFDAVSSIWTTIHGHCRPEIVAAIAGQAARLDHATALGATNPVADELADRLCELTGMHAAFFASDGASAVEAALKMALQYWQSAGEPQRTRFVRLTGGYHGDTAATMSVSDIAIFKQRFGAVTFETLAYDAVDGAVGRDDVAAIIVEPLVQAAAGIRIVPAAKYAPLRNVRPLLIVDEIATGFGRTGTMFAYEQTDLEPDIVCAGKGITGGALALSAALASRAVYEAFLGARSENRQFFHGHSYAGNPIACAAALASLDIFDADRTLAHVASLEPRVRARLERLRAHPAVRDARGIGLMCAVELDGIGAWDVANALYERGFFTRAIGDAIQFVPPLTTAAPEAEAFFDALEAELPG